MQNKALIYVLSEKKFIGAKNLPVIKIKFFDFKIDLSSFDVLIFTSKNAVEAIDRVDKTWKNKKIYSIGSETTKTIREKNADVVYTAKKFYGDDFAIEIKNMLLNKKVLFPHAKVILSKLNKILKDDGVDFTEIIVYETVCNDTQLQKPKKNSTIIFSSPSTIKCFFKKFVWDKSYKAIVIGKRTASFMPKDISFVISPIQTISACIKLANK